MNKYFKYLLLSSIMSTAIADVGFKFNVAHYHNQKSLFGITALYNKEFYTINNTSGFLYEISASAMFFSEYNKNRNYFIASIMPLYRKCLNNNICLNFGLGAAYLSNNYIYPSRYQNSKLNFTEKAELSFNTSANAKLTVGIRHISNASISRPNPGLTLLDLGINYSY